ncbi:hypothetical protein SETIT_6G035300v2 [Setaria italica]|uniref:Uncharacterized protein n=1 Tax=Setaria italica TaxID=4555 RepID=A0A368RI39_SETIT|nr:hypothetical protein SETIT_6G035300v2 [Setaria italica]
MDPDVQVDAILASIVYATSILCFHVFLKVKSPTLG